MKNLRLLTAVTALSLLLFSGCEKEMDSPVYNPNPDLSEVDSTACEEPPLRDLGFQQFVSWGKEAALIAASEELQMTYLANFYTLYFENSAANQFFGPKGEYTDQINKTFQDLKRFWDIELDNIILVATHGSVLQDRSKVFKIYKTQYGYSDEKANQYADSVATLLKIYPQYLNGNHPAFTFNQYATPDTTYPGVGQVTAKIIIGDGILQDLDTLGYGDIAPQAILAHEVGHHIQYELGILKKGMKLTPKTARHVELMGDAYAAYFLSHARGAAMQGKRVQDFLELFFNLGDCRFKDDGHHGTPTQRKAAAEWGYKLATDAQQQNHILPSREFARLFDAELANIVKK